MNTNQASVTYRTRQQALEFSRNKLLSGLFGRKSRVSIDDALQYYRSPNLAAHVERNTQGQPTATSDMAVSVVIDVLNRIKDEARKPVADDKQSRVITRAWVKTVWDQAAAAALEAARPAQTVTVAPPVALNGSGAPSSKASQSGAGTTSDNLAPAVDAPVVVTFRGNNRGIIANCFAMKHTGCKKITKAGLAAFLAQNNGRVFINASDAHKPPNQALPTLPLDKNYTNGQPSPATIYQIVDEGGRHQATGLIVNTDNLTTDDASMRLISAAIRAANTAAVTGKFPSLYQPMVTPPSP